MRIVCTSIVAIALLGFTGASLGEFWQPFEIGASGGASGDQFGLSVALDGDTCVIGAPGTNSAFVFSNTSGTWTQVAQLTASGGAIGDAFGVSVALDGDTCLIGAYRTNTKTGSAYVFSNTSGTWSQVAELTALGGASKEFGVSVALDGDTCLIGAQGTNTNTGSAYVFSNTSGTWTQVAQLTDPGGAIGDAFGAGVALDGNTCVIGASGGNSGTGSAFVFSNTSGTWTQVAQLTAILGTTGDYFGNSVALDGDTCVIGAAGSGSSTGSAYVFSNSSGTWTPTAQLTALSGATTEMFGTSVALDGDTCVIGAVGTNSFRGSAYVFSNSGGWTQVAQLTTSGGAPTDYFGHSVALDGDTWPGTIVVGADGTNISTGSAYVYGSTAPAEPTGACCVTSGCIATTDDDCTALGGTWLGEGGTCDNCLPTCPGDLNGDGVVNIRDLLLMLSGWGACP
jgi:hypothetical protein